MEVGELHLGNLGQALRELREEGRAWGRMCENGCGVAHLRKWEVRRCRLFSFPSHAVWGQSGSPDS